MTILEMQTEIQARGWQWREHIFNDGLEYDCYIQFTQDKSPHALSESSKALMPADRVGWGRYPRAEAWNKAFRKIVLGVDD